jgi:hypothetical protein
VGGLTCEYWAVFAGSIFGLDKWFKQGGLWREKVGMPQGLKPDFSSGP